MMATLVIILLFIYSTYSQNLTFINITSPRVVPDFNTNYANQYLGCKITKYTNHSAAASNYFITQQHQDYSDIIFRADAFNPTLHSILPQYGNYSINGGSYDREYAVEQVPSYDICTSPTTNDIILCYHRLSASNTKITYTTCAYFNRNTEKWSPIFDISNSTSYGQYPPKVLCLYDSYLIIWGESVHNSDTNISTNFQYTLLDLNFHYTSKYFDQTLIEYDVNSFSADFSVTALDKTITLQYVTRNITNNQLIQANLTVSFLYYTSIEDEVPIKYDTSQTIMESITYNPKYGYYSIYGIMSINLTDTCCIITPYATVTSSSDNIRLWMKIMDNKGMNMFSNDTDMTVEDINWNEPGSWDYHLIEMDQINNNHTQRNNYTFDKYFIAVYSFWDTLEIADAIGVVYRLTYDMKDDIYEIKEMNNVNFVEIFGEKAQTECIRYFCMDYLIDEQFLMLGWNGCDHFYGQTWEVTFPYYP
eukprot:2092_1